LSDTVDSDHPTLSGNLDLVCAADHRRRTFLASQAFSAPLHLSKTYWNGETLLINVVNQTAGIFGGDLIRTHVLVEPGACVLLTSPSAARFHPSHGRESRLKQTFEVRSGASLDVFPEISIPQRDSRSFQETLIHVEEGGELLYLETVTPGRVASGEIFAFATYRWATAIHLAGRLVLRERACLSPQGKSLAALRALYPASYYSSMTLLSPVAANWAMDFARAVSELSDPDSVKIAASKLSSGGWSIRLLAADSLALRQTISRLRDLIYQRLGRKTPDPRRN
jgi:urease accessory protein